MELSHKHLVRAERLLELRNARITFAQDHHTNTRGERMNFSAFPHIREMYNTLAADLVIQGSVQSFKALALTTPVHTPTGWVPMGSLKVGDAVSTPDGKGAKILQVQPRGVRQLYKFTLDDGREVESDADHLWKVLRGKRRKSISEGRKSAQWNVSREFEVLTTAEIMRAMSDGSHRFMIPVPTAPVEKPAQPLPIDPYLVGLMLGDGEIGGRNLRFCTEDPELVKALSHCVRSRGLEVRQDRNKYYFRKRPDALASPWAVSELKDDFAKLGLLDKHSREKFIPWVYKNGSVEQRLAVLQGLMDTDGYASDKGGVGITLTSEALIRDIQEIVWSLGGVAKYVERESYYTNYGHRVKGRNAFALMISLPHPRDAFRLARKRAKVSANHRRTATLGSKIASCTPASKEECQCIVLDNKEHLFVINDYVVTHNSELMIIDHLAAAYCGLSVFYVIPKYEARVTYVQNRIDRCVERVPFYKDVLGEGFFDSVAIKSFGKGVVKYVSSNVKADFREFPADIVYVEEVDECDQTNLPLAVDRTRASPYQFSRRVGNPKSPGTGINGYYLDSDQNEWHVPCYACGKYSKLDWFETVVRPIKNDAGLVVDYRLLDTEWRTDCGRDIYPICKCGGRLERASSKGLWRAMNPSSPIVGYHTSMLVSLLNDVSGMYVRFKKAQSDPNLLQAFYNSELGLPFNAPGSRVTPELLRSCVHPSYSMIITESSAHVADDQHVGPCSMGVDVGSAFDVRISYVTPSGHRLAMFMGKVHGVDELKQLMLRYNVKVAVFDAEPEANLVREIQETVAETDVWRCKYRADEGSTNSVTYKDDTRLIQIDRTEALDKSFSHLKRKLNKLPSNFEMILDGEYSEEMCMPVREAVEDSKGRRKYQWTKGKDHQRHADVYDLLASELMQGGQLTVRIG